MKSSITLFFVLVFQLGLAQSGELILLKGKISSPIQELNNVNVLNTRSESTSSSDVHGDFTLFVKEGDTLVFSSIQVQTKKVVIQKADLNKSIYFVSLEPNVIHLEEITVKEYKNINAVSLGIIQKPAKQYTPAERRVRTAGEFHWYSPLLIPLGGMGVDGLMNSVSGRTKMLLKDVQIENKERLILKLESLYGFNYFVDKLKIPEEYVKGFWYYAVEEPKLAAALKSKNKTMASFILADLATQYKIILQSDKKKIDEKGN
jgi:hypothetical protein